MATTSAVVVVPATASGADGITTAGGTWARLRADRADGDRQGRPPVRIHTV